MSEPLPLGSKYLVGIALAAYLLGFCLYYPRVVTAEDEGDYIGQAVAFSQAQIRNTVVDPFTGKSIAVLPSTYQPGTSLLQSVFVRFAGWRGAFTLSAFSLLLTVWLLRRWQSRAGLNPEASILVLGFLPMLLLGRVGMSDVPSAFIVTLGLYLFWVGSSDDSRASALAWLGSGFVAGISLLFRETNCLLFIPLFLGAAFRRQRHWLALVFGGLAGLAVRGVLDKWIFGYWFFTRDPFDASLHHMLTFNLPVYTFALLVLVPGGVLAAALYRGERRIELQCAVGLFVLVYMVLNPHTENGGLKQVVLTTRYFIPLVPLLAFMAAESFPRIGEYLKSRMSVPPAVLTAATMVFCLATVVGCFLVHPLLNRWSQGRASIVAAIYANTPDGAVLTAEPLATRKFVSPAYGPRVLLSREQTTIRELSTLAQRNASSYLVLLDRMDSEFYRNMARQNAAYLQVVSSHCDLKLLHDQWHDTANRLRIWKINRCGESSAGL